MNNERYIFRDPDAPLNERVAGSDWPTDSG